MGQKIDINVFGNQTLRATLENIPLILNFQWDGRNNRYMVEIINSNTLVTVAPQSVEPYSSLDMYNLGLDEFFLIPVMNNPNVNSLGEIEYQFEDLGTNLIIVLFLPDEIPSLSIYAPITTL